VGLNGVGRPKQAIQALERVLARHPYDRDTLAALVAYVREQNRPLQALPNARRLADMEPANAEARQLLERLEAETAGRSPTRWNRGCGLRVRWARRTTRPGCWP
jgi:cytochrome c-type biogenesis protein CcmH/NrfG